ncbi:MAG: hypothetical protein ACPGSD_13925 [Flavobacteriales bacterium]
MKVEIRIKEVDNKKSNSFFLEEVKAVYFLWSYKPLIFLWYLTFYLTPNHSLFHLQTLYPLQEHKKSLFLKIDMPDHVLI